MSPKEEEKQEEPADAPAATEQQRKTDDDYMETVDVENGEDEMEDEIDTKKVHMRVSPDAPWKERMWEVFTTFWPLGLIAFGGPQAHVAILRDHLVEQRDWLDEEAFTELFAIGQVRYGAQTFS
jgi:chromate transporter